MTHPIAIVYGDNNCVRSTGCVHIMGNRNIVNCQKMAIVKGMWNTVVASRGVNEGSNNILFVDKATEGGATDGIIDLTEEKEEARRAASLGAIHERIAAREIHAEAQQRRERDRSQRRSRSRSRERDEVREPIVVDDDDLHLGAQSASPRSEASIDPYIFEMSDDEERVELEQAPVSAVPQPRPIAEKPANSSLAMVPLVGLRCIAAPLEASADETPCPICYVNKRNVVSTCGHMACSLCMDKWAQAQAVTRRGEEVMPCPTCKTMIGHCIIVYNL